MKKSQNFPMFAGSNNLFYGIGEADLNKQEAGKQSLVVAN